MLLVADLVLALHLLWILWVIFGALFTGGRVFLTAVHILSLVWGVIVELGPWPCPLTIAEQLFEARAGAQTYSGAFLTHYLERIVYPDLPESVLVVAGLTVCIFNLAVYAWRYHTRLRSAH